MSARARREGRERRTSSALLVATALALLVAASHCGLRLDLTEDRQFSLSPATEAVLEVLEGRLQGKVHFNRGIEGRQSLLAWRLGTHNFPEAGPGGTGGEGAGKKHGPARSASVA
ncbi:MAG: hypothetical protein H8E31_16205, partial [Planctomycetes bacterium]|nr:hypothetical protein [Planctomycetota bacterium]